MRAQYYGHHRNRRRNYSHSRYGDIFIFIVIVLLVLFIYQRFSIKTVNASVQEERYKYYTSVMVNSGDTLSSIASKYISDEYGSISDYIDEVKEMNYLDSNCMIHSGEYIVVSYYGLKE